MIALGAPLLFLLAAIFDVQERRVPNWLPASLALLALVQALLGGIETLQQAMLAGILVAGVWWPLWYVGAIGGGDHKLLIAGALFGNYFWGLVFSLCTALFGGALLGAMAFIYFVRRVFTGQQGVVVPPSIPYAVAIFFSFLVVSFLRGRFY